MSPFTMGGHPHRDKASMTGVVHWKISAQCESCELFYLGQNEDYSPGDSISESSEKLLQRGRGKVSIDVILVKVHAIKH